jgi:enamine deaminase RidA (YjgF/YER057c/UK114 family)
METKRTFSGATWESQVGYCRGLRVGNQIYISGTTATNTTGGVFAPGNAYAQAKRCFEIIQQALQNLDADLSNIVRTRMFVTDISLWAEFGRAHQEFLGQNPPVTTMVEVKSLIAPTMLIEIEVDAIVSSEVKEK